MDDDSIFTWGEVFNVVDAVDTSASNIFDETSAPTSSDTSVSVDKSYKRPSRRKKGKSRQSRKFKGELEAYS